VYAYARSSPQVLVDPTGLMSRLPDWVGGNSQCGPCETTIYRAVQDEELKDIIQTGRFRNPPGSECKYFSKTRAGAESYAKQAEAAFGEKYTIVETKASCLLVRSLPEIIVDRNVPAVCVPTPFLGQLIPIVGSVKR